VRANVVMEVWKIKRKSNKLCKVTFARECDLKVPSYVVKQIVPSKGNLAY